MSLFDTLFLLAQASAEQPSSGGIFSVPNFFFALIGACILMVIIGAICDHRAARDQDEEEELEDALAGETEDDEFADEAIVAEAETKEEKKRAKQEAKEQKKQEQAQKKQAKAAAKQAKAAAKQAKKKKGKGA